MTALLKFVAALEVLGAAAVLLIVAALVVRPRLALIILIFALPLAVLNGFAGVELWRLRNRGRLLSIGLLGVYVVFSLAQMAMRGVQVVVVLRVVFELAILLALLSRSAAEACAEPRRIVSRVPVRRTPPPRR